MEFVSHIIDGIDIQSSTFCKNDVTELHFYFKCKKNESFVDQCCFLEHGICAVVRAEKMKPDAVTLIRLFVSDYSNQKAEIEELYSTLQITFGACAVSVVQQPCLEGSKLAAWVYAVDVANGNERQQVNVTNHFVDRHSDYVHIWTTGLKSDKCNADSYKQTDTIFDEYNTYLSDNGMNVKGECVRTWLFVKDIDYNYKDVVEARKSFFDQLDMTEKTHYLASTGIEGRIDDPCSNVLMDAYAVGGIVSSQIKHLTAVDYLNPTHEYGVTFERGTSLDFGDRRHIYISGTASIDKKGLVVHTGDVFKQVDRAMVNIKALLADADATGNDIAQMIVYLRDVNDCCLIQEYFTEKYTEIPKIIVLAPVCRPGWLVEIECIAIKDIENKKYSNF